MVVTVVRNSRGWAQGTPPLREDGTLYPYEMIHDQGKWRAYADTPGELLDALIPGYTTLDAGDQAAARLSYAVRSQVTLQAEAAARFDLSDLSDADVAVLLGARDMPPAPAAWTGPVPLVLVTAFYAPIGDLPAPQARADHLIWLDPSSPETLLRSLHLADAIRLHVAPASAGTDTGAESPEAG
jgi:hypothetical protein